MFSYIQQDTKTFTMLEGVGMANKSTKSTQTSVRMAQHNERTRLHDLPCTPTQATCALVMQPCSFIVLSHPHTCLCAFC